MRCICVYYACECTPSDTDITMCYIYGIAICYRYTVYAAGRYDMDSRYSDRTDSTGSRVDASGQYINSKITNTCWESSR
jgi:hypothetical protein